MAVESRSDVRCPADIVAESQPANAEFLTAVGIDGQRRLELAEAFIAGTEDQFQFLFAGSDLKLVFVVIGFLLEFLYFLLPIEVNVRGIAEPGSNRIVRLVRDA